MKIHYLNHSEIDFNKWDDCISKSLNGIVYAYSWYLNIMASKWDALIADDYRIVFPLTKRKKYGIEYLYQPLFTQQLGIFSPTLINQHTIQEFIESIPPKFKYQEINFNTFNTIDSSLGRTYERVTYRLDLIQPYINLSSHYSENTKRNISRALAFGVNVKNGYSANDFIRFYKANLNVKLKNEDFNNLQKIISIALEKRIGDIYLAYTKDNILCAAAFFIRSNEKVIYLAAVSSEVGKSDRAMFLLIDQFIHINSEAHLTLDFEGSNNEGIARFYASFGADRCIYKQLKRNKLPWFLKALKK